MTAEALDQDIERAATDLRAGLSAIFLSSGFGTGGGRYVTGFLRGWQLVKEYDAKDAKAFTKGVWAKLHGEER
jgi:hypothetical protein